MITDLTDHAKILVSHGFFVFPCCTGEKRPATKHGFKDATNDTTKLDLLFVQGSNIAIATGHNGLFVVDFDLPEGAADFQAKHNTFPKTVATHTPRGGQHWYFRSNHRVKTSMSKIAHKTDIRGTDGSVLCPPSVVGGKSYVWIPGQSPDDITVAEAPTWLVELLTTPEHVAVIPALTPAPLPMTSEACAARATYWLEHYSGLAYVGVRNITGLNLACQLRDAGLTLMQAETFMSHYQHRVTNPHTPYTIAEAMSSLRQAYSRPARPSGVAVYAAAPNCTDGGAAHVFATNDPLPTAEAIICASYTANGQSLIVHYAGEFLRWDGRAYRVVEDRSIRAMAYKYLRHAVTPDGEPFAPNTRKIGDVIDALRALCFIPSTIPPPCWLGGPGGWPIAAECLAFPNGILHMPTGDVFTPTPKLFCQSALDFDYDPAAPEPVQWLKFLTQLWPDDPESIQMLQEFFGYCLTADMRQQKALLLVGPKRSGKGTIAGILTHLIGVENVCNPTLASLAGTFGLSPLVGKTLAVIGDARISGRTDSSVIAERLLSIVGGDAISVDRKYLETIRIKPTVRFAILTNELPRLSDASGALSSRFLTVILNRSFYGKEDINLFEKLRMELPGILSWAIVGWRRLQQRGRFIEPNSSADARMDLEDLTSPIAAFVRERCDLGDNLSVSVQNLYAQYKIWATDQGREHVGIRTVFGRDLRAAVPALKVVQSRDGGDRARVYCGIAIKGNPAWIERCRLPMPPS